ncbi:MAG: hypothetical protein JWO09_2584 [Bacteroidetes bacterium]|nr:hypothetical protein [Bacteroidota bacterium]
MKITTISKLNARIAISIAAAGAIISIAFVRSAPKEEQAALTEKKKVAPPMKEADVAYTHYSVSAAESSKLDYSTGSVISIPANAFVDKQGKPVEGKVDIQYREFHDPADFFVSGIPMTYDSAGTEYHFESAGMLEILAYQDGKPVFINPDKKIVVEMASQQQDDKYNIYRFDSLAGNWKFVYKDRASGKTTADVPVASAAPVPAKMPVTAALMEQEKQEELLKPALANNANYQFDLALDLNEFPELSVYKNMKFEVKEGASDFNKGYASVTWSDVSLKKSNTGSYLMTLSYATDSHTFEVNPVFDKAAYAAAFSTYTSMLEERRKQELLLKKQDDSLYAAAQSDRLNRNDLASGSRAKMMALFQKEELVSRTFMISGFGIWNSDCPASLPKGEQFAATYVDSTGKKLRFHALYLVEKGRNAMFKMYSAERLYFNPAKRNIIWALTEENKLAVCLEDDFKALKEKHDSCTVQMQVIGQAIKTTEDVKKILNF